MKFELLKCFCLSATLSIVFVPAFSQRHNNPYFSFSNQSAKRFEYATASMPGAWLNGYELRYGVDPAKMSPLGSSRLKNFHFTGLYYNLKPLNEKTEQGEKDIYGEQFALIAGSDFKLVASKTFQSYLTLGAGPAYVTKTYFEDNDNRLFGSKLNIGIKTDLAMQYVLTRNLSVTANFSYYHISNGGFRIPNGALQLLHTGFGFKYYLYGYEFRRPGKLNSSPCYLAHARSCRPKQNGIEFGIGGGLRGGINNKERILKNTFWTSVNFDVSEHFNLRPTLDIFYNSKPEENMVLATTSEKLTGGTSLMGDVKFDRIILAAGYGVYLYFPSPHHIKNYTKLGVRYRLTDNLYVNYMVKMHRDQPDYTDIGLSVRFK